MKKHVDYSLIEFIAKNFDNERHAQEVQDIIEAIVAELKQDCRDWQRRLGQDDECEAFFEGLICDVQVQEFWEKLDYLAHFEFDY